MNSFPYLSSNFIPSRKFSNSAPRLVTCLACCPEAQCLKRLTNARKKQSGSSERGGLINEIPNDTRQQTIHPSGFHTPGGVFESEEGGFRFYQTVQNELAHLMICWISVLWAYVPRIRILRSPLTSTHSSHAALHVTLHFSTLWRLQLNYQYGFRERIFRGAFMATFNHNENPARRFRCFITKIFNTLRPRDAVQQIGLFPPHVWRILLAHVSDDALFDNRCSRITPNASIYNLALLFQLTTSVIPHPPFWQAKRKVF